MRIDVGDSPLSWGVHCADDPRNEPRQAVLTEIADAGYRQVELGTLGYLPETQPDADPDRRSLRPRSAAGRRRVGDPVETSPTSRGSRLSWASGPCCTRTSRASSSSRTRFTARWRN